MYVRASSPAHSSPYVTPTRGFPTGLPVSASMTWTVNISSPFVSSEYAINLWFGLTWRRENKRQITNHMVGEISGKGKG